MTDSTNPPDDENGDTSATLGARTVESSTESTQGNEETCEQSEPSLFARHPPALRDLDYQVPAEATPVERCEHCGRPFKTDRAVSLHRGEVHASLPADQQAAYEQAREAERDELFLFHIRTVVALGVLYAITVLLFMVALGGDLL